MKRTALTILAFAGLLLLPLGASLFQTEASRKNARPIVHRTPAADGQASEDNVSPRSLFLSDKDSDRNLGDISDDPLHGHGSDDPDLPPGMRGVDKEVYLALREQWTMLRRGYDPDLPFDPDARNRAIGQMGNQLMELETARLEAAKRAGVSPKLSSTAWTPVGPAPVPAGQTETRADPVTGRIISIAVDPTTPDVVFVGTASGGLYRTLNGTAVSPTWTPLFDTVQTQAANGASALGTEAIGVIAIAPSNRNIVYIGTGEQRNGYFGSGLYRIDSATTATPTIVGPINPTATYDASAGSTPAFTFRAISQILVHPTAPGTIYVSTASGRGGISTHNSSSAPTGVPPKGLLGIYRSTNADAASAGTVTFTKLTVNTEGGFTTGNTDISDMVLDPSDTTANKLIAWVRTGGGIATPAPAPGTPCTVNCTGIYRSTSAAGAGTFTQQLVSNNGGVRGELTINSVLPAPGAQPAINPAVGPLPTVTVLAATGETPPVLCAADNSNLGRLRRSVDGGVTWPNTDSGAVGTGGLVRAADGFCGGQCFYDIGVAMDPANASRIQIGGSGNYTPGCNVLTRLSTDGVTMADNSTGLHADVHVFAVSPSSTARVWHGDDGGLWRSTDSGATWTSMNGDPAATTNPTGKLSASQYVSIATHPIDREYMTGGTQDNGTHLKRALGDTGEWTQIAFGDGGYTAIDQNAANTDTVTIYHTYYNLVGAAPQIQYEYATTTALAKTKTWTTRDCVAGGAGNTRIDCADTAVSFYAPLVLGPGTPNTVYFGTDRLYRSANGGDTMQLVSQGPISGAGTEMTTISVGLGNDLVRLVGMRDGTVWMTTTGSAVLTDVSPAGRPAGVTVGKVLVDPNNTSAAAMTAYVAYGGFGTTGTPFTHFFKTTNLAGGAGTWVAMSTGLPDIPINAIAVDRRSAVAPLAGTSIYLGTDIGVYRSTDGGTTWAVFNPTNTLPVVPIFDIAFQEQLGQGNPNRILRLGTHGRGIWEIATSAPAAANGTISGTITDGGGASISGVTITLSGTELREAITDAAGHYSFDSVETNGFYTVTPSRANYSFTPASRSFSSLGVHTEASFTASANGDRSNAIDTTEFFVRQHYLDFLGREPDAPGFAGWVTTINNCVANDPSCDRVHVSESFFRSQEFQERGYFAYRFYATALGRKPDYAEFTPDLARVSGFLTNDQLEAAKTRLIDDFMSRPAFAGRYNSLGNAAYVDQLMNTAGVNVANRQSLVDALNNRTATRAQVLRTIAESGEVYQKYYNQAFVVMEYFGYLHRDPDAMYTTWIAELDRTGSARRMVDGFVNSTEYRNRFAP